MELMNTYLEALAGYINDEDKLVTYKWLSKELEIHVNVAKQVLEEYWNKNKSSDELVATIMIIGYTKDGGMRVEVIKESDFVAAAAAAAADKYDRIISQHLYSLQKSLPDLQLLAEVGQGDTKFSAITCKNAVVLSDEELFKRRWGREQTYEVPVEHKPPEPKKGIMSSFAKAADKVSDSKSNNDKSDDNNVSNGVKDKEEKVEVKKVSPVKNKPADTKKGVPKKPVQSQKTGLNNLFGKVAAANSKKSPPKKDSDKEKENKSNGVEDSPMEIDESQVVVSNGLSVSKSNSEVSNSEASQKSNGSTKANKVKSKQNRGSKRNRSRDSSKEDTKKRKRIFIASDSSDESAAEQEPDFFDDLPPPEPTVTRKSPSPPPVKLVEGKRKVRKAVDKTFVDEEGFLVTKKTFVYESASDEETPPPAVVKEREVKKATDKAAVAQIKKQNKQTSIMSFFKKA
ncbi:GSCOCG00010494001-RA-CDS [Cotesia congregata]|uniref:DNA polymerase delta subunit 3 n=1 Tax=Cotesia congregata TaxID=51543 RepID=A0A8J2H6Z4_COTCN|nr:GSCOCG00010494001-RA-CDS [Cotesia congregata]CAG5080758.1 Similar to Pold3: DNA polymerase delta subunit 3 (Mus musculus) [Cotesia congregata]